VTHFHDWAHPSTVTTESEDNFDFIVFRHAHGGATKRIFVIAVERTATFSPVVFRIDTPSVDDPNKANKIWIPCSMPQES
jgi:hypothetical protein